MESFSGGLSPCLEPSNLLCWSSDRRFLSFYSLFPVPCSSHPLSGLAFHLPCPDQKAHELPAHGPHKTKHLCRGQRLGPLPRVGLHPPAQVLAPPRSQPVSARCIPDKAECANQEGSFPLKYSWRLFQRSRPQNPLAAGHFAEKAVRRRFELGNHVFQRRLLRLG